jgi:methylthioribose-1-phosphate isomerase
MSELKSLEWRNGKVRFIDQTWLPLEERYVETDDETVVAHAIRNLEIRGAPLIGIAAAYAVALAASKLHENRPSDSIVSLDKVINSLAGTRPTAMNLFWALDRQRHVIERTKARGITAVRQELLKEALRIHDEDSSMCDRIGKHGADVVPNAASILTHCNTGSLATGGIGTALGVVRVCWEQHKLRHVYIDETRPLFQGTRLTAWELQRAGIPFTLITDNTAGFLMQQGIVNAILVGADRIAANGDVANKIGTYNLAVLARYHDVPMFVAAPSSTIDFGMKNGKGIPIEQRSGREVTEPFGTRIAPKGSEVYSPAFDITPSELITAIVTEGGILRSPYTESIAGLRHGQGM